MTEHNRLPDVDETAHRERMLEGLIDLAAFLEANPAVPVPRFEWILGVPSGVGMNRDADQRAEIDRIAGLLGVPVLDGPRVGGHYIARRHFGPVTYEAVHIPAPHMAAHHALRSYDPNISAGLDEDAA